MHHARTADVSNRVSGLSVLNTHRHQALMMMRVTFPTTFRNLFGLTCTRRNHQTADTIDQGARPSQDTFSSLKCLRAPNKIKRMKSASISYSLKLSVTQSSPSMFFRVPAALPQQVSHTCARPAVTEGVRFGDLENRRRGVASACRSPHCLPGGGTGSRALRPVQGGPSCAFGGSDGLPPQPDPRPTGAEARRRRLEPIGPWFGAPPPRRR